MNTLTSVGLHNCHPLSGLTKAQCLTCLPLCLPSLYPPSQALQMPKVALLFLTRGDLFHHGVWERWFKAGAVGWWAAGRGGQAVQAAADGSACTSQEAVFGSLLLPSCMKLQGEPSLPAFSSRPAARRAAAHRGMQQLLSCCSWRACGRACPTRAAAARRRRPAAAAGNARAAGSRLRLGRAGWAACGQRRQCH